MCIFAKVLCLQTEHFKSKGKIGSSWVQGKVQANQNVAMFHLSFSTIKGIHFDFEKYTNLDKFCPTMSVPRHGVDFSLS